MARDDDRNDQRQAELPMKEEAVKVTSSVLASIAARILTTGRYTRGEVMALAGSTLSQYEKR